MSAQGWFVYLVECVDGSLYAGIATDVARRYGEHAAGHGARYTRSHPPRALLGPLDLRKWLRPQEPAEHVPCYRCDETGEVPDDFDILPATRACPDCEGSGEQEIVGELLPPGIHWVITGGESGKGA